MNGFYVGLWNTVLCSGSFKCICGSINGNLLREIWCSRRVWSAFYGWQLMIADHDYVFCYDSSILPTMNKSSRNLVPDIEIAVHPWHWAPLSVVSMMVSVWHSRTLEGSALDLFPLKFGNVPQTSPWFLPLPFFLYLESPKLSSSWFSDSQSLWAFFWLVVC